MTYSYDHRAAPPVRTRLERGLILGGSVALAVAGVVSVVHLVDQYGKSGDYRAELAAKREAERAQYAAERAPPVPVDPPVIAVPSSANAEDPFEGLTPEERRLLERELEKHEIRVPAPAPAPRQSTSQPLEWARSPDWPSVGADAFPEGAGRISVQFRCRATRDGRLTNCSSREQPAGSGLAARMRPALSGARVAPTIIDGRAVESDVTFGISFTAPPPRWVRPTPPTPAPSSTGEPPPVWLPPSSLPSTDRLNPPPAAKPSAPEPAPAPAG